jgi:hypothetical protein
MRYASKEQLLTAIRSEHGRLVELVEGVPPEQRLEPGVWGEGWTLLDLVAHLAEWHRMFLRWYREGLAGQAPEMPAPGFKWNETPRLNREIRARHKDRPWSEIRDDFERSYQEILDLVGELSEGELLVPGHFTWTGKHPLTTYLGANTASHYRFGSKVLERWRRPLERS